MRKLFLHLKGINKIKKNKKRIENSLHISIDIKGHALTIESEKKDNVDEYLASRIIDAMALGFDFDVASQLKDEDFIFRKILIRSYVRETRAKVVAGRIIGTKGKTKELIEKLSETDIAVHDNIVAIIGHFNNVNIASQAIETLIHGSPQSKAYAFLERSRAKLLELSEENIEDFIEK